LLHHKSCRLACARAKTLTDGNYILVDELKECITGPEIDLLKGIKVIVGGFMSLDGKIAPVNRVGRTFTKFMTARHHRMLHTIRSEVDAIIVGVETVIADDPSLTVREVKGKNPIRVVLDSNARTPLDSRVLNGEAATIIAVTRNAPKDRIESLTRKAEVIKSGQSRVDVKELLRKLRGRGVKKVLVEGGGETRWSFFKQRVVDDFFVWVMPYVWGGRDAPTMVGGEGFVKPKDAVSLKLRGMRVVDRILILSFSVTK
jgi:2,5-diamino-6-(ribosylamino)-4(3H)-pyrimidinone 5'-phosphate reductase